MKQTLKSDEKEVENEGRKEKKKENFIEMNKTERKMKKDIEEKKRKNNKTMKKKTTTKNEEINLKGTPKHKLNDREKDKKTL